MLSPLPAIFLSACLLGGLVAPTAAFATGSHHGHGDHGLGGPNPAAGVCVGIRGNGPRLWAHFTSLARITEEFGLVSGAAGGSSGSLSVFLVESVRANPLVEDCGRTPCSPRERAAREALLFKAIQGVEDVGLTEDILTIIDLIGVIQTEGIAALLEDPETAQEGIDALIDVLSDPAIQQIVNPELIALLLNSPDPAFHARDIVTALGNAASFTVTDPNVFVRPGVINFESISELIGRLGNFLAGYGPIDRPAYRGFLKACGRAGRGLDWPDVAPLAAPGGTCGELFISLFDAYRDALGPDDPSRLDDPIGRYVPALVTTSVLEGDAVDAFQAAKTSYFNAVPIDSLGVSFEDVRFGYWGRERDLRRVRRRLPGLFSDAKSEKFSKIGESPWREILGFSPAEPGLSRALELPDGRVSAGGWTDPVPAQVLRALGCRRTILINRRDGIGTFTTDVATQLGASADEIDDLFDLGDPDSGFTSALRDADGVWCTDWDAPPTLDIPGLSAEGFGAPLETSVRPWLRGYDGASRDIAIPGCTPGLLP